MAHATWVVLTGDTRRLDRMIRQANQGEMIRQAWATVGQALSTSMGSTANQPRTR
jgi:hypothetical protein